MHGVDKAHFLENTSAIEGAEGVGSVCPWFHLSPSSLSPSQRTLPQARDIVVPFNEKKKTGGQSFEEQN